MDGQPQDAGTLFKPAWPVVSGDQAVCAKALEINLEVMTTPEFPAILEGKTLA